MLRDTSPSLSFTHFCLTRKEKEHVLGLKQQMMEIKAKEEEVSTTIPISATHLLLQAQRLEQQQSDLLKEQLKLQQAVRTKLECLHKLFTWILGGGEETS